MRFRKSRLAERACPLSRCPTPIGSERTLAPPSGIEVGLVEVVCLCVRELGGLGRGEQESPQVPAGGGGGAGRPPWGWAAGGCVCAAAGGLPWAGRCLVTGRWVRKAAPSWVRQGWGRAWAWRGCSCGWGGVGEAGCRGGWGGRPGRRRPQGMRWGLAPFSRRGVC